MSFPSTLTLAGLSEEDKAIYQCVAENSAGSCLAVTGDPGQPPAPRGLQGMALSISVIPVSWEPPAPNRDIIGYVPNLRPVGGGVWVGSQESLATPAPDGWYPWASSFHSSRSPHLAGPLLGFWVCGSLVSPHALVPLLILAPISAAPSLLSVETWLAQPGTRRGFMPPLWSGGCLC